MDSAFEPGSALETNFRRSGLAIAVSLLCFLKRCKLCEAAPNPKRKDNARTLSNREL